MSLSLSLAALRIGKVRCACLTSPGGVLISLCVDIMACMAVGQGQQMMMQSGQMHQMCLAGRSSAIMPKISGR